MNLVNTLKLIVETFGNNTAIIHPGGEIKYKTLDEAIDRLARGLQRLGVSRGDRVAVMLPNVPHFIIAYYATLRLGAVVVPVNTMYKGRETSWVLEDSEAKVLFVWDSIFDEINRHIGVIKSLKHLVVLGKETPPGTIGMTQLIARSQPITDMVDIEEEDPAVIQYTAGVTGTPKGVELSHRSLVSNINACREIMRVTGKDQFLAILPLFLPMGQTLSMNLAISSGAAMQLQPIFNAKEACKSLLEDKNTLFIGVPSMFKMLIDSLEEDETEIKYPLRLCICGAGGIAEELLKDFERRFKTYILECYTTVETSPVVSFNQWRTGRRVGSLGHPLPGVDMRVVNENDEEVSIGEVGEIVVQGPNVMNGYINRPRTTSEILRNGWFHTGDLGKMDINGFFYLVDRLNNRIIKGGFSIYPTEVEDVLYGHPDVKEVAVVPIPDETMGQEVKACIVLREGASVTTEQLADYCRKRMAYYKVPAVIRYYQDLPKTPTGRIDKKELKK